MRRVIVSAADRRFGDLLKGLVCSIREHEGAASAALVMLDCGLEGEQRRWLKEMGVGIVVPEWDYEGDFPASFKAMTARPHLPRWVPGYDLYTWIDADAWVQDFAALELVWSAAAEVGFAAVPEADRSYPELIGPAPDELKEPVIQFRHRTLKQFFGPEVAAKLCGFATVNSGVFAARADSPAWQAWPGLMAQALNKSPRNAFFADQVSLNVVLFTKAPFARLPAWCNWMCNRRLPMIGEKGAFVEPEYPHRRIGILHMTAKTKQRRFILDRIDGGKVERSLHFARPPPAA